jgi:hypothetical protein
MTYDPHTPDTTEPASAVTLAERPAVIRRRLPNRHNCEITTFEIGGVKYTACVG